MPIIHKLREAAKKNETLKLDRKDIVDILKNKDAYLEECEKKRIQYMKDLKTVESEMASLSDISFMNKQIETTKKEENELKKKYSESIEFICKKESIVHHVWFYFQELPFNEKRILEELYINRNGWKNVCGSLNKSRNFICNLKNKGLDTIMMQINKN